MTSIAPRTTGTFAVDDQSWLGSAHGTDATKTGTLDVSRFDQETYYPDGVIPSGTPVGVVTATGLLGSYKTSGSAGDDVLYGHLVSAVKVEPGVTRISVGVLTRGDVVEANLPFPVDANGKADVVNRIWYV